MNLRNRAPSRRSSDVSFPSVVLAALLLITGFTAFFTTVSAHAVPGVAVHMEVREAGGAPMQQMIHIVGQTMKMDAVGDRRGSFVFKGGTDEVLIIDDEAREYMKLDRAAIERMASTVNAATEQIGGLLEGLSPEQRAALENMLGDKLPEAKPAAPKRPLLRSTGRKGQHSGYETRQVEVLVNGEKRSEFWIANWQGVDSRVKTAIDAMSRFMKGVIDKLPAKFSEPIKTSGYEVIGDLGGMPMMTREYDKAGQIVNESKITRIENADIDVTGFNPPKGYTQKSLPI